jgi:nucleotide-binding universal stress UspA family protein
VTTLAAALAGADLVLVHAAPDGVLPAMESTIRRWYRAETRTGDDPTIVCLAGEPAQVLLACAARFDATLIAVGSHSHAHDKTQHRLGHTVSTLLHPADRPVMICPPNIDQPPPPYLELLAGFNDTSASYAALAFARRLGDQIKASVHAVTVVDTVPITESVTSARHQIRAAEVLALEQLDAAVAQTLGHTDVTTSTRYGRPVAKLLELTNDADLLIVGNKRRGLLTRAVAGSTTRSCALQTPKPLIAVPQLSAVGNPK